MKNYKTAAALAILFGTFSLHKIYQREPVQAILRLFFIWTGIPTILGIIEGVYYLTHPEEYRGKYNKG